MTNTELDILTEEVKNNDDSIKVTSLEELSKEYSKSYPDGTLKNSPKRKKSKAWYISVTHVLTSLFAIPIIVSLFYVYLIEGILPLNGIYKELVSNLVILIGIFLGVIYSSGYLNRKYIISSEIKEKIIKLTTIYFILLFLSFFLINLLLNGFSYYLLNNSILYMLILIIFHFLSKKYIKINT